MMNPRELCQKLGEVLGCFISRHREFPFSQALEEKESRIRCPAGLELCRATENTLPLGF